GHGDAFLHDNIIVNAGSFGIFADERTSIGPGMRILNNTIINPKKDGIRLYTDLVTNVVRNNVIVNPGSYSTYTYPRTGNDAYIYLLKKTMNVQMSNNYLTRSISAPKFVNPWSFNYRLASGSPLINKGANISTYRISKDFYQQARLKGYTYDIGACEY
ncbi:MAG TPA: choice-of-anchor Q domain-containing protein, partial [Chryseosolibacter sp.]|nr:choice-of-anchor Q domain-containing protein [Chryseosolibacter sp.]